MAWSAQELSQDPQSCRDPRAVQADDPEGGEGGPWFGYDAFPTTMDVIDKILPELQAKAAQRGYDALSHAERIVLDVTAIEMQVGNGGFYQLFHGQSGDRVMEGIAALHEIGAHATAALVQESCNRFPRKKPSTKWFVRQKQLLDKLSDDTFYDLDKRFYDNPERMSKLLVAYWKKHGARSSRRSG